MKIITFNVNGVRSILNKDKDGTKGTSNNNVLKTLVEEHGVDVMCLQETKCPEDCNLDLLKYTKILNSKIKKGYSGVAISSNIQPIKIHEDFPHNEEGRVICYEYPKFFLVNVYTPNSKPDLSRLDYRVNIWEPAIIKYLNHLQESKPIIYVGDLNVAPTELDIHTAKGHQKTHGFTKEERDAFAKLTKECNLIDAFRHLHPTEKVYSWFSNFAKSRERNKGWRIDHILLSTSLKRKLVSCEILGDFKGSDHVPVLVNINI